MRTILAIALVALCGALVMQAATVETAPLTAKVPFAFQVGDTQLPAGKYTISPAAPGVLWVRDLDQRAAANIQAVPARPKTVRDKGLLVFYKYGERYFLREVWRPGMANGAQIRQTKAEREIAQADVPERVNVWVVAYNQ